MEDMSNLSVRRRPSPWQWAAAALLGVLLVLALASVVRRSHFETPLLRQALAEDAGFAASVPREVVDARELMRAQREDLSPLSLGQGLKDDPLLQQRMWEALYPARFSDADTPHRLLKADDPLAATCQVLDRRGNVVLANCR